jgi:hypothetical protein
VQEAVAAGDLPPLDVDAANVFSQSEHILQEHVRKHGTNAAELQDLIQRVHHHPDFNAADVDHDLHERLMKAVEDGDIQRGLSIRIANPIRLFAGCLQNLPRGSARTMGRSFRYPPRETWIGRQGS